ncbi:methyltransferase domain-containing protein [Litoribacter alkaliphilus]|uniref:Methyltransferase domain-containing protein n=1 Tax=Litoribacter ruber TaxID=702568 RepID=A0AAP2CFZ2_9BACT|nr:methyltransferase domain-containing protein [Litoribacter alkaliphilus]MBS9522794.1 methyltransferase domain-containing protein [Litoribacter alkaliphilus]
MNTCKLCGLNKVTPLIIPHDKRIYNYCPDCYLIFVDSTFHIDLQQEKRLILRRNNSIGNAEYVHYISQIIQLIRPFIYQGQIGLDYGCGPTPTLNHLLKKENITCFNNDYNFGFNHPFKKYDFIMAIECLEKFKDPNNEIDKLLDLLKPGGIFGMMTEVYPTKDNFKYWNKKLDPSHVSFYHQKTLDYLIANKKLTLLKSDSKRIFIFEKQ